MNEIYDVAIVGAGPAGISAAIEAKLLGLSVVLLEKDAQTSNTIRKFYKAGKRVDKDYKGQIVDFRGHISYGDGNRETTLEFFDELLQKHEISPIFGSTVEKITPDPKTGVFSLINSKNDTFFARFCVIAIGKMGQPNKPDYKIPSSILRKISYNINDIAPGENVLVVGGGNSAAEYAIALHEITPTTLTHRRDSFPNVNEINLADLARAEKSGMKILLNISIESVLEADPEHGEKKVAVNFSDGSVRVFDRVVYAIGGTVPLDFLKRCEISLNENKLPIVNDFESSVKNIFVIGDILSKSGSSIGIGVNQGFDVAQIIAARSRS